MRFAALVCLFASLFCLTAECQDARFIAPSNCYSPLLQAKLDFHGQDNYRLAYLSLVTRETFDTFKGTGFLSGLFLAPPANLESSWSIFHDNQVKEMQRISLTVEQERERSLSTLKLDPQAGDIIKTCLTGGLGLSYTYWSTSQTSTILQLNWRGQGGIPLKIVKSDVQNANSRLAKGKGVLFDAPYTIKESQTITLTRLDPNDDITVTFVLDPQVKYDPPIISPFPKRKKCSYQTYTQDPVSGQPYNFRISRNVNEEKYLRRNVQAIYGTDWYFEFTAPPPDIKLFTDDGTVAITSATCDKDHQEFIDIVGANKGPTAPANPVGPATVACEGGKNGQPGEIWLYGSFTVTAQKCEDVDW
jgi:hypothetical protein